MHRGPKRRVADDPIGAVPKRRRHERVEKIDRGRPVVVVKISLAITGVDANCAMTSALCPSPHAGSQTLVIRSTPIAGNAWRKARVWQTAALEVI
jgi:hypothetical protein